MLQRLHNQKGFSFIEAILTTALMSWALWGILTVFYSASNSSLEGDYRVVASQLASEKMEEVIADKSFQGYSPITEANYPDETLADPYNGFARETDVTEVDPSDLSTPQVGSGYKRVDVRVTWGSDDSDTTIVVSTVLTDYT